MCYESIKSKLNNYYLLSVTIYLVLAIFSLRGFLLSIGDYVNAGDLKWDPFILDVLDSSISHTLDFDSLRRYPIWKPLLVSFKLLGFSSDSLLKFMMLFIKTFMGFSMYFALHNTFNESQSETKESIFIISLLGGYIYSYNPMAISYLGPKLNMALAYALVPLIIYYFNSLLRDNNNDHNKNLIITAILYTTSITLQIHYLVLIGILFIFIIIYHIIQSYSIEYFIYLIRNVFLLSILCVTFSLYWILPSINVITSGVTLIPDYVLTADMLEVFSRPGYEDVLRLMGNWLPSVPLQQNSSLWIISSYMIPLFTFLTLILPHRNLKRKKLVIMYSFLSLPIIFLNKGLDPFGIYLALYEIPIIGWLFRVPTKFGLILAFLYTMLITTTVFWFVDKIYSNSESGRNSAILGVIVMSIIASVAIVGEVAYSGDYDLNTFTFKTIPASYYEIEDFLVAGDRFAFYPQAPSWVYEDQVILNEKEIRLIEKTIKDNSTNDLVDFMNLRSLDFLFFTDPNENIPGLESNQTNQLRYYKNQDPDDIFTVLSQEVLVIGGLDTSFTIDNDFIDSTRSIILFDDGYEGIEHVETIFINSEGNSDYLVHNASKVMTPYDFTSRHSPNEIWSKASTSEPLHGEWQPYLENRDIESWDSDFGKGLVFTWANYILEEQYTVKEMNTLARIGFENKTIKNWSINARDVQSLMISDDSYEGAYCLETTVNRSTWGWKTINSPLIPAVYSDLYRWDFYVKGRNSEKAHAKIAEYNNNNELIANHYVSSIGTGTFSWKKFSLIFTPTLIETSYMQLQIWHGHETSQPIPNIILIDDIKIYDLTDYLQPNSLEMPFTIKDPGEYCVYLRYFQNSDGGSIGLTLDGNLKENINTMSQINSFTWKKVFTSNLTSGKHTLDLENKDGFNAVNLVVLLSEEEDNKLLEKFSSLLQERNIVYTFEAESDMQRENAVISNKYGALASNGEVLELSGSSKAWKTFEVLHPGEYSVLMRINGIATFEIAETSIKINSTALNWIDLGTINVEACENGITISPFSTSLLWNFEKEAIKWIFNSPTNQIMSINAEAYDGDYSLQAALNASTSGWKTIKSPKIPVISGQTYTWDLQMMGENTHNVHIKIGEYNTNNESMSSTLVKKIEKTNFSWTNLVIEHKPSLNASFVDLQIWHGHLSKQPLPNIIRIDNVKLDISSELDLDAILLISNKADNNIQETHLISEINQTTILYSQKINPTKYILTVNATKPFLISFAESFDPLWEAKINGEASNSFPLYSTINGFWINQAGELKITIEYKPQKWFYYGLVASIIGIIVIFGLYLLFNPHTKRHIQRFDKPYLEEITT